MLNAIVDFVAVVEASCILQAQPLREGGAGVLSKVSGVSLVVLGAYLALAPRPQHQEGAKACIEVSDRNGSGLWCAEIAVP